MSKFLIIFFVLRMETLWAQIPYRGGAELVDPSAYRVQMSISAFMMNAHFETSGSEVPKAEGSSFLMNDSNLKLSYGLGDKLETSLLARYRYINSSDSADSVIKHGPESLGLEFKYAFLPIKNWQYALGVRYRKTLYTNAVYVTPQTPPADEMILGDDGSEYGVDAYLTYTNHSWKIDFKGGYNAPPNDLSAEIIYDTSVHYNYKKFGFMLGLEGIYSLKNDQYTDTPGQKPLMSTGQTSLFNSLNREIMAPYLGFDYSFEKFLLGIKAQSVVAGKSTDKGNSILALITWNSIGETPEAKKINDFKEYSIDGSVLKVSSRGNFVKIDQGLSTDVEKGAKFDIYQTDYFGGNELVASGIIFNVGSDWSIIKLTKKYKETEIKPGFAARGN